MPAEPAEMPPNPNTPAIIAITMKIIDQRNIILILIFKKDVNELFSTSNMLFEH